MLKDRWVTLCDTLEVIGVTCTSKTPHAMCLVPLCLTRSSLEFLMTVYFCFLWVREVGWSGSSIRWTYCKRTAWSNNREKEKGEGWAFFYWSRLYTTRLSGGCSSFQLTPFFFSFAIFSFFFSFFWFMHNSIVMGFSTCLPRPRTSAWLKLSFACEPISSEKRDDGQKRKWDFKDIII